MHMATRTKRWTLAELEPDLMVRQPQTGGRDWDDAPTPILVVEVLSGSTRRRDLGEKRQLYLDARVVIEVPAIFG